jgi:hypothetical protein
VFFSQRYLWEKPEASRLKFLMGFITLLGGGGGIISQSHIAAHDPSDLGDTYADTHSICCVLTGFLAHTLR